MAADDVLTGGLARPVSGGQGSDIATDLNAGWRDTGRFDPVSVRGCTATADRVWSGAARCDYHSARRAQLVVFGMGGFHRAPSC